MTILHAKTDNQTVVVTLGIFSIKVKGSVSRDLLFSEVVEITANTQPLNERAFIPRWELTAILTSRREDGVVLIEGQYLSRESLQSQTLLDFLTKEGGKDYLPFLSVFGFIETAYGIEENVSHDQVVAVNAWCEKEKNHFTSFDVVGGTSFLYVAFNLGFAQSDLISAFNLPPITKKIKEADGDENPETLPKVRQAKEQQKVYAIGNQEHGVVKIGIAKNPETRLKELQTGCPYPLSLISVSKPKKNAKAIEQKLHQELSKHQLTGEWFRFEACNEIDWHSI